MEEMYKSIGADQGSTASLKLIQIICFSVTSMLYLRAKFIMLLIIRVLLMKAALIWIDSGCAKGTIDHLPRKRSFGSRFKSGNFVKETKEHNPHSRYKLLVVA